MASTAGALVAAVHPLGESERGGPRPEMVYGRAEQGAAFGHTKISGKQVPLCGLSPLAVTLCTPRRLRSWSGFGRVPQGRLVTRRDQSGRVNGRQGHGSGSSCLALLLAQISRSTASNSILTERDPLPAVCLRHWRREAMAT